MTKNGLLQYRHIVKEIRWAESELERLRAKLYGPKSQHITGMPSGPAKPGSALEEAVVNNAEELQELVEYYEAKCKELLRQQLAIEQAIDSLEPTARLLLRYRYIDGHKWEEVCCLLGYSWRQTHRLHADALQELRGETHD